MKSLLRRHLRNQRGQGLTEYIVIVALIAIATLGVISVLSQNVRALFAAASGSLGGDPNATVESYGSAGKGQAAGKKTLEDFGDINKR
jgi:pilus assembly protein Flp/PilA